MRELKARAVRLTTLCNRPVSEDELGILLAWVDAVLLDYCLVQALLGGKIGVVLPTETIASLEQFIAVMKVNIASRVKPRFN